MSLIVFIGPQKCETLFYNSTGKNITQQLLMSQLLRVIFIVKLHAAAGNFAEYVIQRRCFFLEFGELFEQKRFSKTHISECF